MREGERERNGGERERKRKEIVADNEYHVDRESWFCERTKNKRDKRNKIKIDKETSFVKQDWFMTSFVVAWSVASPLPIQCGAQFFGGGSNPRVGSDLINSQATYKCSDKLTRAWLPTRF